jgi:hypothetical protein
LTPIVRTIGGRLARQPTHTDPIVRDLQVIRTLRWSKPKGFSRLSLLVDHPLVVHVTAQTGHTRVEALKQILEIVAGRLTSKDVESEANDKLLRLASRALLRLEPKYADMPVEDIRHAIVEEWPKRTTAGYLSSGGFRQHIEVSEVYEPFAKQLRAYALEQSAETGLHLDFARDDTNGQATAPSLVELGPSGRRLLELEEAAHLKRMRALSEGIARIRNEDEMIETLMTLTELAQRAIQAVDYIAISEWFSSRRLSKYLDRQLVRAADVSLERIRLVDDTEISRRERREQLVDFISRHDDAGATLLLCPVESARDGGTLFYPRMGLLLIDPDNEPTAITGWLGEGRIERAMLYTRETEPLLELKRDYDTLRTGAIKHNKRLRDELYRLIAEDQNQPL